MTEQRDHPSPPLKPDAAAKKQWVEPEIEVLPAFETSAIAHPLGGADFGSNITS
jgi:hypothetical protein